MKELKCCQIVTEYPNADPDGNPIYVDRSIFFATKEVAAKFLESQADTIFNDYDNPFIELLIPASDGNDIYKVYIPAEEKLYYIYKGSAEYSVTLDDIQDDYYGEIVDMIDYISPDYRPISLFLDDEIINQIKGGE